jgi:hypothetical protein
LDRVSKAKVIINLLLVVVAFAVIGFLTVCCKKKAIRCRYVIALRLTILLEITGIVVAYISDDTIVKTIEKAWNDHKLVETRRDIEKTLNCCGSENITENEHECGWEPEEGYHIQSCKEAIKEKMKKYA